MWMWAHPTMATAGGARSDICPAEVIAALWIVDATRGSAMA